MQITCPVCDHGTLNEGVVVESIPYHGTELAVAGIEVSTCAHCGEETILPQQLKRNEQRFADAKRRHDGLLTSAEILQWRRDLKITQAQAALILGGGPNALSKYERGEVIQSRAMDNLMRLTGRFSEARRFLFNHARIPLPSNGWITIAPGAEPQRLSAKVVRQEPLLDSGEWSSDAGQRYG